MRPVSYTLLHTQTLSQRDIGQNMSLQNKTQTHKLFFLSPLYSSLSTTQLLCLSHSVSIFYYVSRRTQNATALLYWMTAERFHWRDFRGWNSENVASHTHTQAFFCTCVPLVMSSAMSVFGRVTPIGRCVWGRDGLWLCVCVYEIYVCVCRGLLVFREMCLCDREGFYLFGKLCVCVCEVQCVSLVCLLVCVPDREVCVFICEK